MDEWRGKKMEGWVNKPRLFRYINDCKEGWMGAWKDEWMFD